MTTKERKMTETKLVFPYYTVSMELVTCCQQREENQLIRGDAQVKYLLKRNIVFLQ